MDAIFTSFLWTSFRPSSSGPRIPDAGFRQYRYGRRSTIMRMFCNVPVLQNTLNFKKPNIFHSFSCSLLRRTRIRTDTIRCLSVLNFFYSPCHVHRACRLPSLNPSLQSTFGFMWHAFQARAVLSWVIRFDERYCKVRKAVMSA